MKVHTFKNVKDIPENMRKSVNRVLSGEPVFVCLTDKHGGLDKIMNDDEVKKLDLSSFNHKEVYEKGPYTILTVYD